MSREPIHAAEVKSERVEWLWRNRIPCGMISVIAGRPDQGKGLFATHLASFASNKGWRVLFSAAEDSHGLMTRPRLEAAGAQLGRIILWRFRLPADQLELFELVKKYNIQLIIIDPLASHLSGGVSRHSDNIREVLAPLTELIEETGTAVVIIEHALKRVPANGHPLNAIGGSGSGLPAAARAAFLFGVDPSDPDRRVLAPVKFNIGPKPEAFGFEIDVEDVEGAGTMPFLVADQDIKGFSAASLLTAKGATSDAYGRPADKRAAACEWLTSYFINAGGAVLSKTINEDAKQYGMSTRTLRRAADDMGIVRQPASGPKCAWDLPPKLKQLLKIGTTVPSPNGGTPLQPLTTPQPADLTGGDWDDALVDLMGGDDAPA